MFGLSPGSCDRHNPDSVMIETLIRQLATGSRVEKTAELEVALHELGIGFRAQNQHIELVAPLELLDETTLRAGI